MTETAPAPAPIPEAAPVSAAPNTIGLVAIIVAGVGFLLGIIPPTSGIAWILLIPAIVLAIIGLTRKGKKKGTSLAALIIGIVGWIVAIIVFLVSALFLVGDAITSAVDDVESGSESSETATEEVPEEAVLPALGETVTTDEGNSFAITAVTCGLGNIGSEYLENIPSGQFCEVRFTLANGSDEPFSVYASDVSATIGTATYDSDEGVQNTFGGDYFGTEINPGLSIEGIMYFDIPVDKAIETITYKPTFSFDQPIVVAVS